MPAIVLADRNGLVEGPRFIEDGNPETVILAHLETRRAVENTDAILSNPYGDIALLGMYDLSVGFGQAGNLQNPNLVEGVEQVMASGQKHGKIIVMHVSDGEVARRRYDKGVTFFETASELDLIIEGARSAIREFRAIVGK
jgi:4-hydroxy-2-oxoheptanedioate aldolase